MTPTKKPAAPDDSTKIKSKLAGLNKSFKSAKERPEQVSNTNDWLASNAKLNALRARKK